MSEHDNGGKAFPVAPTLLYGGDPGMDLRDYFAARAMLGILCDPQRKPLDHFGYNSISKHAYLLADEMLKARKE